MGRLFGTDGIRGIANKDLTCEIAFKLGQVCALEFNKSRHRAEILIGKDTRVSGDMLESAIVAGIASAGGIAKIIGIIPTPGVAYLTRLYGADAGIVISASHNSVEYNGLKVFNSEGYKLADELEDEIEKMILSGERQELPVGPDVGRSEFEEDAKRDYIDFLVSTVDYRLDGMKIVLDAANGAASAIAPAVFSRLGADVICTGCEPDGNNINLNCGSTHPEDLQKKVISEHADIGLAFDGDADRLIAVDDKGRLVDGDRVMGICSRFMKEHGLLKQDTLVVTVMSNLGLKLFLKENGIRYAETAVGDRYVLEEMRKSGYNLGGEQSGHVIALDRNTTGDGVMTALLLLNVVKKEGKALSELADMIPILPQILVNVRLPKEVEYDLKGDRELWDRVEAIEKEMEGRGRVLIRKSGTEPLIRIMIEGEDQEDIDAKAHELADIISVKTK